MTRPPTRLWLKLACAGLAVGSAAGALAASPRPNVLIILADDFGDRDVGFQNPHTFYETPNIDRLARQGTQFSQAYANCPVCSPSRYSLQTGKYPVRSGLTDWLAGWNEPQRFLPAVLTQQMALGETTIAEALKPYGYETAFIGKWHLGGKPMYWPEHQGYDMNIGGCNLAHPVTYFSPYQNPRLADGPRGEYLPERLARDAISVLERFKTDGKPFFLCYCDYLVHRPLEAPDGLVAKYRAKAARLGLDPKGRFGSEPQYDLTKDPRRVLLTQSNPVYAAMVEALDSAAGTLLNALDRLGLTDNTLVIFTSDNGGLSTGEDFATSNEPFRAGKGWVYEGGIREPLVIRWPGHVPAGQVRSEPAIGMDLYPTILEAAGARVPPGVKLDGRSLLPAVRGEPSPPRDLFWHYPHYSPQGGFPGAAIRSGDLKLIEDLEDGHVWLYNLKEDPIERHDLATGEPAETKRLLDRLSDWQRETGARFLRAHPGGPTPWHPDWWHPPVASTPGPVTPAVLEPWQLSRLDD